MADVMIGYKKVDWHSLSKEEVLEILRADANGLTDQEVRERLSLYGYNEITEEKRKSPLAIFAKQFKEPLIIILLAATVISAFIGEVVDAVVIIAIVILATIVGFVQEYRSEKAVEALKKMVSLTVRVVRNKEEKITDVRELVPGDIILVSVGDRIPADAYLLEGFNIEVDEAPLTGESVPVPKSICKLAKETPIAERQNVVHMITTLTYGHGKAVVFATGMRTELGKIAGAVQKIELQKTPFEIRMRHIGKLLSVIMLIAVGVISVLGFLRGHEILEILIWGISLAVAAVPEALPAVVAASLTIGVYRMAKQNAIVRGLPSVETLGSTTVICSDKTGTLTKGEMTARRVYVYDIQTEVTGTGYSYVGEVVDSGINKSDLELLARTAALCNDAYVKVSEDRTSVVGDPTEAALVILARKTSIVKEEVDAKYPRVHEVSFTSERKRMTTVHKVNDKFYAFMKGAVEIVLSRCANVQVDGKPLPLVKDIHPRILSANDEMATRGLRVLALAYKELDREDFTESHLESSLTFLGLVGMMDPPRTEAINAVRQCKTAGIDVLMITGDHKLTAAAVAEEIGISDKETQVMSGTELDAIDVSSLTEQVERTKVYARVSPEHKIKIVQALKNKGHIVAMTGDGINDAPALKSADIGVAMGITGTQVTKEASSMVLADDNFASIVSAVREGRRILDNVKKYLVYLLSVNIGEIIILGFSVIMGWPFPLLAKHILYINLATDGSPAIALGLEPHEPDIMKRKPRDPKEGIFFGIRKWLIGISILLAVVSLSLFWYVLEVHGWNSELAVAKARTMMFGLIVFFELFFALSCRSFKHNLPALGLLSNKLLIYSLLGESSAILFIMNHPVMQGIFDLAPLAFTDWVLMLVLATAGFMYGEIIKFLGQRNKKSM
jgi:Ca2+-transporting ATPase